MKKYVVFGNYKWISIDSVYRGREWVVWGEIGEVGRKLEIGEKLEFRKIKVLWIRFDCIELGLVF